jgi:hypothetical protein
MAGLSLRTAGSAGFAPASVPVAANAPSSNIAQRAYGVQANGLNGMSRVPAYGSVALGLAGAAVLVWLWYSLPR